MNKTNNIIKPNNNNQKINKCKILYKTNKKLNNKTHLKYF